MTKLERLRKYQLGGTFDFVSANEELREQLNLPFQTLVPEMLNPLEGNAITGIKMPDINKELKLVNQAPSVNSSPSESSQLSPSAMSGIATAGIEGVKAIDQALMGDKNFGALSEAIDSAVHMTSSALMQSGNPYAMAAAAALEGANFLTKAGGQTVQGYDVDIASSGYGTLNHMESKSSRDFGAAIGLGGLNKFKMDKLLARRNLQALMALEAADIAEELKFEQEARMNSVENVIQRNQAALNGDLDTSLLGA